MQRNQTISIPSIERPLPVLPEARPPGQTIISDVAVPALQNFVGGVGAVVFVERVLTLSTELVRDDVMMWSFSAGLLLFGATTAVRAFRDEVVLCLRSYAEKRNNQDYTELAENNAALRLQIVTLQTEIDRLAAQDGGSGNGAIIQLAYRLLSDYYLNKLPFTQVAVAERKVCSRALWTVCSGFFKQAKIVDGNGGVLIDNLQDAFSEFMRAHHICTHSENVGGRLIKVMPPAGKKS